jgi:alpha-mannosidase
MIRTSCSKALVTALTALTLAATLAAQSAPKPITTTVFKIGDFNRSSVEFASGDPKQPVNFLAAESNPAKDWFGTQPVVFNPAQQTGVAAAPRAISFSLDRVPAAAYKFHLAVLVKGASVPAMKVSINGKDGLFYLHPKLDYEDGDQGDAFDPAYSSADIEFVFPGSYLHAGANSIALQPVEEADVPIPGARITYDAIALDTASAVPSPALTANIEPTIFFHQQNGALTETVAAFIRSGKPIAASSSADLLLAGKHYHAALPASQSFGEARIEFQVPEFPAQTQAQLTVHLSGHTQKFTQPIDPAKKWTVLIVPHIHVDVGYSDYQAKVAAIQARTLDEAMTMTAHHPDFRFSLDGYWDFEQFLKTRSLAQQQKAIAAIQKEQLFIPAQYASLLTGIPTTETLIRSLYPSANFARKYGTPFNYANITDVPSYTWSYASVLAAAGIPYLFSGSDNYRAPVLLEGRLNENSPMRWVGPDDKSVVLWYSRHYMQMDMLFGMPPVLAAGRDTLPLYLQMYSHPNYHADSVILFGTQVENTDLFPQQAELADKWNSQYAYPRMQYSGFHAALAGILKQFGDTLPSIRGDGGPYWEDGAGSDAHYLAMERWNESRAQTAEKLDTLTSLVNPQLKTNLDELARLWTGMTLMDEHTWDSYNSVNDPTSREAVEQLAIKDQYAVNAHAEADFIVKRSMANLTDAIPAGPRSLIVFNTLNWKRSGTVSLDISKTDEIVDLLTGQPVPSETLHTGRDFARVRFLAQDVPPVGYKVYITRRAQAAAPMPEPEQVTSLESPYYKVELDPETGAVRSIYDKQLQKELVSQDSPYRFGQYLYVTGGDKAPNTILQYSLVSPKPNLDIHAAANGKLLSVVRTPFGQVARLRSDSLNTPSIETEIRLFDNEKKIEFVEQVDKKSVTAKEAAYFAFPFSMKQPQFQYEIQNGVVDPSKDMYAGAGHEWFTVQHWVSAQQDGVSATVMPLDAPLVTLGDINRGAWPEQFGQRPGTIFSYVMNNYWDTNYRAEQGGRFSFHYVITSAASTDAAKLSRVGWEEITPLEQNFVTTQDKAVSQSQTEPAAPTSAAVSASALDGKQDSFLNVSDPNLLLETWKPAEDGNGTILRFLDFGGSERSVTVRTPWLHLDQVTQTDAVERGNTAITLDGDNQFSITVHPWEILTVRVVAKQQ